MTIYLKFWWDLKSSIYIYGIFSDLIQHNYKRAAERLPYLGHSFLVDILQIQSYPSFRIHFVKSFQHYFQGPKKYNASQKQSNMDTKFFNTQFSICENSLACEGCKNLAGILAAGFSGSLGPPPKPRFNSTSTGSVSLNSNNESKLDLEWER